MLKVVGSLSPLYYRTGMGMMLFLSDQRNYMHYTLEFIQYQFQEAKNFKYVEEETSFFFPKETLIINCLFFFFSLLIL